MSKTLHQEQLALIQIEPGVQRLRVDDMLIKYCGEFGPWQRKQFLLASLAWALEAFHAMVLIFADHVPAWRCTSSGTTCYTDMCEMEPGSWEWVGGARSSTVAEFGLICSQKYKVGLVQTLFFAASMIGAGVFGHLSDSKLGRRGCLLIVCISNSIFGCLTALSPGYWTYTMCRIFTGFSTGGIGLCAFVLATEPVGPSNRGFAGMSSFYFFSGGMAALSTIAYFCKSWRSLYIASSIPSILFLLIVIPFVSESPRWYLVRGQIDRAMDVMHRIAKSNGTHIPYGVILALDRNVDDNFAPDKFQPNHELEEEEELPGGTLTDVLYSPLTRNRLFLAVTFGILCAVVDNGLSLNVVNLGTNIYLNVFLNSIFEMPAFFISAIMLDCIGRKPLTIGTQWFSGLFCVIGGSLKCYGMLPGLQVVCEILGVLGMSGAYNLLYIYTTELFPTTVRNATLGCVSQASELGAIVAPMVVVLGGGKPFWVFGICGIAGGVLGFFLPETLHKPLFDTMDGMNEGKCEHVNA